jgi:hypothetical protein
MPDLQNIILLAGVNSLVVLGFFWASEEQMLLSFLRKIKLPYSIRKPLYDCPTCMSSFHSVLPFWLVMPFEWQSLAIYPFYILIVAAITTIIKAKVDQL